MSKNTERKRMQGTVNIEDLNVQESSKNNGYDFYEDGFKQIHRLKRAKWASERTTKTARNYWKIFLDKTGATCFDELTNDLYDEFMYDFENEVKEDGEKRSVHYINSMIKYYNAMFKVLYEKGLIKELMHQEKRKGQKKIVETLTLDEQIILTESPRTNYLNKVDISDIKMRAICVMFLATGMRADTLIHLKIEDIDFQKRLVWLTKLKNYEIQNIKLNNSTLQVIEEYLNTGLFDNSEGYLFPDANGNKYSETGRLHKNMRRYFNRKGVDTKRRLLHMFRHTFAKNWIINGGDVTKLSKALGHKELETTMIYVNLFSTDLHESQEEYNCMSFVEAERERRKQAQRKIEIEAV